MVSNTDNGYLVGIAHSEIIPQNVPFLTIPFTNESCTEITFEIYLNNEYETITLPLTVGNNDSNVENYTDSFSGNYPNPFNISAIVRSPGTNISFSVEKDNTPVEINIYNIKGKVVKTFASAAFQSGNNQVVWNGKDETDKTVSSGIYFSQVKIGTKVFTGKMMLLK